MTASSTCVFCEPSNLEGKIIRHERHFISFVSTPWFRAGHSLVVPTRHVTTIAELLPEESGAIMSEIGRISALLDDGFGSGVMQKYQPTQPENGIKVNHLHFHVFPRHKEEDGLFPVPKPNDFTGFSQPSSDDIQQLVLKLRSPK